MRSVCSSRLCGSSPTPGACIWRTSAITSAPILMIPSHEVSTSCRDYVPKPPGGDMLLVVPPASRDGDMRKEDR